MTDADIISTVHEMIGKIRAVGELPNTVLMHPSIARMRSIKGNARERKRARFHNFKRCAFLKEHFGLDVRCVKVPRSMLSSL